MKTARPSTQSQTRPALFALHCVSLIAAALLSGCSGGSGASTTPPVSTYKLTVNSASPASGVTISASPADNSGTTSGSTTFSLTYNAATSVTLTAPATSGSNKFSAWTGCTSTSGTSGATCSVTMNANTSVTANYAAPPALSITISPNPATVVIGATQQFTATVTGASGGNGSGGNSVTWSLQSPSNSALSPGTITTAGLFTTPYPAPTAVTVVATSTQDSTVSASALVNLHQPDPAAAPSLTVDAGNPTHPINPFIYGMNYYQLNSTVAKDTYLPINRWGGDSATSYSYLDDTENSAGDYYFENFPGTASNYPVDSQFNSQFTANLANGTKTLGTVPLIGYTPLRNNACSFSVAKYGAQKETDPYNPDCGNGVLLDGTHIVNDPTDTYSVIDDTFTANWVKFLVTQFGTAANGGVAIYDLDNEPEWWDAVHIDVHPKPFNYDELTTKALAYAKAIKTNDPTAQVSGPVISFWMDFFYSKQDIESGWSTGPCYCPNGNPTDRLAHADIPLIEYYLQQFKHYEDTNNQRLLDYLDLHTYFTADNLSFAPAGDTAAQQARLNSTRVFWDPTYTDPNYTDPNDRTSSAAPFPPQLIPMMQAWVSKDYPGTKTAITEYNWGAQEHINGALAQADILGIFGREGLDLATLWSPPDPVKQLPGLMAFELFRNYDGAGAKFGDTALASTSSDQGKLSIYGAHRSSDGAITILALNKTYEVLNGSISLPNLTTTSTKAHAWLYSNADLAAIVPQPDLTITSPPTGSTTSSISTTYPAQSITLITIPAP